MKLTYPDDLPPEHRPPYRRGWNDRGAVGGRKAGKMSTDAKAAAARANGAKGGRPRSKPPLE